jgi:16S rRNA (guanine966-N2)-methyltransferase
VTYVERDPRAVRLIEANLQHCRVSDRYAIIRARVADAAARLERGGFDVIFLDPPYGRGETVEAVSAAAPLLSDEGLLVVEHARRDPSPESVNGLQRTRTLTSGDSALSLYCRAAPGT